VPANWNWDIFAVMQLQLPIFPRDATLISDCVGMYERDGLVQYIVNGMPIYCHGKEDYQGFRFIFCNLIRQGLCRKTEIHKAFHVTIDYINRAWLTYEKEGEAGFFKPENRHGYCYKLIGERLEKAQLLLDSGKSNSATAREVGVAESAIRYSIKKGYLKKKKSESVHQLQAASPQNGAKRISMDQ